MFSSIRRICSVRHTNLKSVLRVEADKAFKRGGLLQLPFFIGEKA